MSSTLPRLHDFKPASLHYIRLLLAVALSYSSQILDEDVIPVTPNDVFIDALVTPSGVIYIRSGASEKCP